MPISLIAACTPDRVIGKDNAMPWHMPADLQYFRQTTRHKTILMGRRTFESIGHALPQRKNIVVTRNPAFYAPNIDVFHSITSALEHISSCGQEIFVIGGAEIFTACLPLANKLYLTFIHCTIPGDTYFPVWEKNAWQEIFREEHLSNTLNPYSYSFVILERI